MILISHPTPLKGEADLLNNMFEAGLPVLHLRKPNSESADFERMLEGIQSDYYLQIALHQHHHLIEKYGLKRIHFTEKSRNETTQKVLDDCFKKGYKISTSVHSIQAYNALQVDFQYTFLSPVFDSISKENYPATSFDMSKKDKTSPIKLIGLGGVNFDNYQQIFAKGYDDYAVLGSVWNSKNPLDALKRFLENGI